MKFRSTMLLCKQNYRDIFQLVLVEFSISYGFCWNSARVQSKERKRNNCHLSAQNPIKIKLNQYKSHKRFNFLIPYMYQLKSEDCNFNFTGVVGVKCKLIASTFNYLITWWQLSYELYLNCIRKSLRCPECKQIFVFDLNVSNFILFVLDMVLGAGFLAQINFLQPINKTNKYHIFVKNGLRNRLQLIKTRNFDPWVYL
jgi:hypothetical protein